MLAGSLMHQGVVSGKYSEDFEVYQSYLEAQLEHEEEESDEQDDGDDRDYLKKQQESDDEKSDSESEEQDFAKLTFTVQDAKALRASLEMDRSIQKSIASSIKEELDDSIEVDDDVKNKTGFGLDEIEEELVEAQSSNDSFEVKDVSEELIEGDNEEDGENNMKGSLDESSFLKQKQSDKVKARQQEDLFQLKGAAPKARPVSASKKREESDRHLIDVVKSQDIMAAIAEENRKLSEYQGKREIHSAPTPQVVDLPSKPRKERPQTRPNKLTENDITEITEKVRKLNGRQQRKLLKMLSDLETIDDSFKDSWNFENEKSKVFLQEEKNDRSDTRIKKDLESSYLPDKKNDLSLNPKSSLDNQLKDSSSESDTWATFTSSSSVVGKSYDDGDIDIRSLTKTENKLEILFEFLNNWGNENFIGLTEIQIFRVNNELLNINPDDIKILSRNESKQSLKNIVNHKTKTVKEKYMWKCCYDTSHHLELLVSLINVEQDDVKEIVLWNYNRSLQDLNIGVKDCRVFIGGEIKWEGTIDKGCGNQIFDYSNVIKLQNSEEESEDDFHKKKQPGEGRSETRTLDYSVINKKNLPTIEIASKKNPDDMPAKDQQKTSLIRKLNTREEEIDILSQFTKRTTPVDRSVTTPGSKPLWLEDSSKVKKDRPSSSASLEILEDPRPRSRPSSGRRSQQSQVKDSNDHEQQPGTPVSGRRSKLSEMSETQKEIDDLFDLNSRPKKSLGKRRIHSSIEQENKTSLSVPEPQPTGRRSPLLIDLPSSKENTDKAKTERQKFKDLMDVDLEQSLQSIDKFKFHHMGRITSNLNDDEDFGSFLEPMKQKDQLILRSKMDEMNQNDKVEEEDVDSGEDSTGIFELPILPKGKELLINIKTTWGDRHYVGLNGIEVFSDTGKLVKVKNIQANPSNINVLPEYDGDPRVVENLIDGCFLTRDDMHLWLTPFSQGGDHFIELQFEEMSSIAMIRIWNYNKSRIHSTRGARFVEMALDGKLIFLGEIARASGVLSSDDPYGDTILFTMDEDVLELVAQNDFTYEVEDESEEEFLAASGDFTERPKTANNETDEPQGRPFTCPKSRESSREGSRGENRKLGKEVSKDVPLINLRESIPSPQDGFMQCKVLSIYFTSTWGDQHYLGLTGLEVLGETFEKIPLTLDMLEAIPRDLNDLDEYEDDDRTLDKLINDVNVTMSDENMWMIPYCDEDSHVLRIHFSEQTIVTGVRLWNYNKSLEDTFRGVKTMSIYLDDHEVSPSDGFLVRKGPGHCHFDFAQDILFNVPNSVDYEFESSRSRKVNLQKIVNEYETFMMPSGFVFQLKLFSSWGDPYYIGLNGIEVYDHHGQKMQLSDNNITAFPHSVNVLTDVIDDVRTPDKLIDGVNDTYDGRHMWLSPILPAQGNIVYIVFDEPVTISMIKLWNYSKTPGRGVRQFGLLVDDLLVYSGILPQCALYSRAILPGLEVPVTHHTVLFTDAEEIVMKEKKHVLSSSIALQEQNVQLTNDRSVINTYHDNKNEVKGAADQAMRPMTSVKSSAKLRR